MYFLQSYWPHTARYCDAIAAIPYITRCFLREVCTHSPKMVRYPTRRYFNSHRYISAMPHFATYRAKIVRYTMKEAQKSFAILPLQVSRYEKYCCWAYKSANIGGVHGEGGEFARRGVDALWVEIRFMNQSYLSRPDLCNVDFCSATPKF